jgi:hypothetical protein
MLFGNNTNDCDSSNMDQQRHRLMMASGSTTQQPTTPAGIASVPPSQTSSSLATGGEEAHRCDMCGKTFAVPARLTRHYRTHTGN